MPRWFADDFIENRTLYDIIITKDEYIIEDSIAYLKDYLDALKKTNSK